MDFGNFVQAGINWFGNELQARRQADAAEAANAFSAQQYASRYQTTVKDMQAAGINPMLAYGSGPGNAPSGQMAQVPNSAHGVNEAFNQSKVTDAQVRLMEAQASAASAQAAKTLAETPEGQLGQSLLRLQGSSALLNERQLAQVDANVDRIRAEIPLLNQNTKNALDQGAVLRQTAQMLSQQSTLMAQQGATQEVIRAQLEATIKKLASETRLNELDIAAAEKFENFGREFQQYKPIIDLLKTVLGRGR